MGVWQADLSSRRKVDKAEAEEYATENGLIHMETSAKDASGGNVKKLFQEIALRLPKTPVQPERDSFPIVAPKAKPKACC